MKLIASSLRRLSLAVLTILLVVSSFAVFTPSASAETYQVKLGSDKGLLQFQPKSITIKPGDTIEWVNNKLAPHNVVFDSAKNPKQSAELAKSLSQTKLLLNPGQSVTTTFPADAPTGEYSFYCTPHRGAGMTGKVIVQ
ncbi:plastocyanin [Calothrix sp. FACHB-1219]|uniref:plastocyanin n=1 Tax=unclassified Calothrix TaxID=2619626 RepID=UPI0016877865|nr:MULTISPECIES: plastocyanin [unclassified Calothrix]MBD2203011.1 plastocyanin [Calothrix sp. FACHB-168]MBD2216139.1 plastocyanin [Calothrix sp. FACHB-1219]